jgi:hypothetical protein
LLCLAKSIHVAARGRTNTAGAVLCPAATVFQCAVLFQLRRSCSSRCTCSIHGDLARTEEQRRSTAARGCRASMLNTNTVINAQTNELFCRAQSIPGFRCFQYSMYWSIREMLAAERHKIISQATNVTCGDITAFFYP